MWRASPVLCRAVKKSDVHQNRFYVHTFYVDGFHQFSTTRFPSLIIQIFNNSMDKIGTLISKGDQQKRNRHLNMERKKHDTFYWNIYVNLALRRFSELRSRHLTVDLKFSIWKWFRHRQETWFIFDSLLSQKQTKRHHSEGLFTCRKLIP